MKPILLKTDFAAALQAERAVVYVHFPWSAAALASRRIAEQWESELATQGSKRDWVVYVLAPDTQPSTWQWVGANAVDLDSTAAHAGVVVWLKAGVVAACARDIAGLGVEGLARLTREHFHWPQAPVAATPGSDGSAGCDPGLLKMLCCPETHQSLAPAPLGMLENINRQIASGNLRSRNGQPVQEPVAGGLVRADGRYLYPIRHRIPIMLVDEAIPLPV